MIPDSLHYAGEAWSGASEVGDLVQDDCQGLFSGLCGKEAQRRLPGREATAGGIQNAGAKLAGDRLSKATELDRFRLLC